VVALRPVEFQILLALAQEERHGYAILQDTERLAGRRLRIGPGTLYRALHRLLECGWVAEADQRPVQAGDDERRRYYRLTSAGRRVAANEARRLAELVSSARASGLLSRA